MRDWLMGLWENETRFSAALRSVGTALATMGATGQLEAYLPVWAVGLVVALGGAGALSAGAKGGK